MQRYKVYLTKAYELEIEAEGEDAAIEAALETPLEKWADPYESEICIGEIEGE